MCTDCDPAAYTWPTLVPATQLVTAHAEGYAAGQVAPRVSPKPPLYSEECTNCHGQRLHCRTFRHCCEWCSHAPMREK